MNLKGYFGVGIMNNNNNNKNELIMNLDKLHTTDLGVIRIRRNLSLDVDDVVDWCREKTKESNASIRRKGKNWYVHIGGCEITINAYSFTIITAHKLKDGIES